MDLNFLKKPLLRNAVLDRFLNLAFWCVVAWGLSTLTLEAYIYIYGYLPLYKSERTFISVIKFITEREIKRPRVLINNTAIAVELAVSDEEKMRGLSGRPSLFQNAGMLFIFSRPDYYRFWMPNMNFPIDFIWIDETGRIIGITENAPPLADTSKPVWYLPPLPAKYVLEVNAGFAKRHNIQIGDIVKFENIPSNF
jgi:uncharacterized membrane protein (UPF0127 family)